MKTVEVSPARRQAATREAVELLAELRAAYPDDELLAIDAIDGQTELFEIMDRYGEGAAQLTEWLKAIHEKISTLEARRDRYRSVVQRILEAVGIKSVQRTLYAASLVQRAETLITDEALLPPQYLRPDKTAIAAALRRGESVPGATLGNASPHLTMRVR